MKKLLLFDIDGTLLRAQDATRHAMNEAFRELFFTDKSIEDFKDLTFFGWTDLALFEGAAFKLIGRPLAKKEYDAFIKIYAEHLQNHLQTCNFYLMPGIAELLPRLASREDVILGLETGNIEPAAYLKLKRGRIDGFFRCGGFGSDSADRAELIQAGIDRANRLNHDLISKENIYVIGDAPHDITAGNKLGVNTIAVGTGLGDQAQVMAANPTVYFQDLADIQALLNFLELNRES